MAKEKQLNITQQVEAFRQGKYEATDVDTQFDAGWYDWFCADKALAGKTRKLYKKLIKILESPKFDCDKTYMFMKNNCPASAEKHLYDDFRICDIETRKVIYCVTPKSSFSGKAEIFDADKNETVLVGSWQEVVAWFLEPVCSSQIQTPEPAIVVKSWDALPPELSDGSLTYSTRVLEHNYRKMQEALETLAKGFDCTDGIPVSTYITNLHTLAKQALPK